MKNKRSVTIVLIIGCMLSAILTGCNTFKVAENDQILVNTDNQDAMGSDQAILPISGLWICETGENALPDQVIMITDLSFYWLQVQGQSVREEFSDIVSLDLASGHMQVRMRWIRMNGQQMGFDSPTYNLSFVLDGDVLRITDGAGAGGRQETEYPDLPDDSSPAFYRK